MTNKDKIDKLKKLQEAVQKTVKDFPQIAGTIAVNFSKDNFKRQAYSDEEAWPKREINTNKQDGILIKTRMLNRSIRIIQMDTTPNASSVIYGSTLPYARIHNEGGQIPITAKSRRYFWAMYLKAKNNGNVKNALHWKYMALSKKTHFDIKKRKFLGNSNRLAAHILFILEKKIKPFF